MLKLLLAADSRVPINRTIERSKTYENQFHDTRCLHHRDLYLVDFPHSSLRVSRSRCNGYLADYPTHAQKPSVNSSPLFVRRIDSGPQCGVISKKWPQRVLRIVPPATVGQNGSGVRKKVIARGSDWYSMLSDLVSYKFIFQFIKYCFNRAIFNKFIY